MAPRLSLPQRLAPRIQLGAALALLVVGGSAGALLYSLHRRDLVAELRDSTTAQGALVEQGLRHAMLDRDPELLSALVRRLGEEPGVDGVHVLDRRGEVRFSSDPGLVGTRFSLSDPTCLLCHRKTPEERGQTAILRRADGRRVLRNVNPIRNGPECAACHKPAERLNGVLIVDHSLDRIEGRLRAEAGTFAAGTLATLAVLGAVLGVLLHRLVLGPVARIGSALAAAERGDLAGRLPAGGGDEMASLGEQFNRMAASLKETMARLHEREAHLGRILASADDGMVVVDRELRVVTANAAYLALCGKTLEEVVGVTCCFAPQCRQTQAGDCPSWVAFQGAASHRVIRRITDDRGGTRTFEISASPLEVDGEALQTLEVWRDITTRTRLEAELTHSDRLASLGLLASGISHEINNPLATITTCLDGLQRRLGEEPMRSGPGPEVVGRYLELIQKEVHRCRDLTRKLVLLSQKSSPIREPVDVNLAIQETLSLLEFEAARLSARIASDLAPELPPVRGDEAQLRQVMLNLLMNALEAIGDRGAIRIESRLEGDRVRVVLTDDGRGIAPADLERIFDPFYSARPGRRGTGLGLFISNQIVHQHGGAIAIASQPGEGTEVTVVLPLDGGRADEGPDLRPPGR